MPQILEFENATARFEPVFGLEVHVELSTATKMFDHAPAGFGADPNTNITPVSLGLPGSLPVVNRAAIEYAMKLGLALNCQIAPFSRFARKNYFYPDLDKAYQISQYDEPLAHDGYVDVELEDGTLFRVPIERAHVEEDAGKNTHVGGQAGRIQGSDHALVDYNRAGVPLVEIVTKPVVGAGARAPEVAGAYVRAIRDIARALGISRARMEQGNIRADVNVSLRPKGSSELGVRSETKNVNSFRGIENTVRYEIRRQAGILVAGDPVYQETRNYEVDGTTSAGRVKSDADDYRYFPDPDLVPLAPSKEWVERLRAELPELPIARRRRLRAEWGFSEAEMRDVVNAEATDLIEATVAAGAKPDAARKWWMGELAKAAKDGGVALEGLAVTPAQVAQLQKLVDAGTLSDKLARQVLAGVLAGEGDPGEIVEKRGLKMADEGALRTAVQAAIDANPDVVEKIRGGKTKAAGALVGAVMRATRGKADARRARELILELVG